MTSYQVRRETLRRHARDLDAHNKKMQNELNLATANTNLVLSGDDVGWAASDVLAAYNAERQYIFWCMQQNVDVVHDIRLGVLTAERLYGDTEVEVANSILILQALMRDNGLGKTTDGDIEGISPSEG